MRTGTEGVACSWSSVQRHSKSSGEAFGGKLHDLGYTPPREAAIHVVDVGLHNAGAFWRKYRGIIMGSDSDFGCASGVVVQGKIETFDGQASDLR